MQEELNFKFKYNTEEYVIDFLPLQEYLKTISGVDSVKLGEFHIVWGEYIDFESNDIGQEPNLKYFNFNKKGKSLKFVRTSLGSIKNIEEDGHSIIFNIGHKTWCLNELFHATYNFTTKSWTFE